MLATMRGLVWVPSGPQIGQGPGFCSRTRIFAWRRTHKATTVLRSPGNADLARSRLLSVSGVCRAHTLTHSEIRVCQNVHISTYNIAWDTQGLIHTGRVVSLRRLLTWTVVQHSCTPIALCKGCSTHCLVQGMQHPLPCAGDAAPIALCRGCSTH